MVFNLRFVLPQKIPAMKKGRRACTVTGPISLTVIGSPACTASLFYHG
jgi:hypothetical protein